MLSQISTDSNGIPRTGSPTTLPLRNEWALLPEEGSSEWSDEVNLPETQINNEPGPGAPEVGETQASGHSDQIEDWELVDKYEDVENPCT